MRAGREKVRGRQSPLNHLLSGKNILITGGTSALGSAFVRAAVRRGGHVFFTYFRNRKEALRLTRLGARGFELDLSDQGATRRMVLEFKRKVTRLDILIHNAAVPDNCSFLNLPDQTWERLMTVNWEAPVLLIRRLRPLLAKTAAGARKKKTGQPAKIFVIVSRVAITGGAGLACYSAAKAGLMGLVKSLARQWGRKGILVNAVNPGFMISRMTRQAGAKTLAKNRQDSVLGRMSEPSEAADFLVYLCSDRMSQVSGQVFHYESRVISGL
jgi:3-oxoacyl-[acyl-carrier protein] reductase